MICKPCPHHKLLWEFHLEGVSTGIYLQKSGIYVSNIVQVFQLLYCIVLTFSTKHITECEICSCIVHYTHFCQNAA